MSLSVGDRVEVRYRAPTPPYTARVIKVSKDWAAISYGGNDLWYRKTSYVQDPNTGTWSLQYEDQRSFNVEPESQEAPSQVATAEQLAVGTLVVFRKAQPIKARIKSLDPCFVCLGHAAGLWVAREHVRFDTTSNELFVRGTTRARYGSPPVLMPPNTQLGAPLTAQPQAGHRVGDEYLQAKVTAVHEDALDIELRTAFDTGAKNLYAARVPASALYYDNAYTLKFNLGLLLHAAEIPIPRHVLLNYQPNQYLFVWYGINQSQMYPSKITKVTEETYTISYGGNDLVFPKSAALSLPGFPYPVLDYTRRR